MRFSIRSKKEIPKKRSDSELSAEEEARKRCEGRGHEHGQHVVLHAASVDVAHAPHFSPACKQTCAQMPCAEPRWPNIADGNEGRLCCVEGGHQIVSALQLCLAARHHTRSVHSLFADTI